MPINQSINQSFINSAGHKLTPYQTNVREFWRLWLRSYLFARLKSFTFKLSKFTKGMFTWHRGDFRAGARSLQFPLMALHFFTWYHHKMSCRRESPRREFTFVLSQIQLTRLPRSLGQARVHSGCCTGERISPRNETSQRYSVNAKRPPVLVWNRSTGGPEKGKACVMFAILNGTCILSTWSVPSNRPFVLVDHVINFR